MAAVTFTIELNPIPKKNSGRIIQIKGHAALIPSKQYCDYEAAAIRFCPFTAIDTPVNVEAHYFRDSRRKVDITNLESALLDVLVKAHTLVDDNCAIVVSTDGSRVHYDKERPRTEVVITPSVEVEKEFTKTKGDK